MVVDVFERYLWIHRLKRVVGLRCTTIRKFWRGILALTGREKQVLGLLMQGGTNKAIARALSISDFTVRDHVSSLLHKYGVANRMSLMVMCGRLGGNDQGVPGPPTSVGLRV